MWHFFGMTSKNSLGFGNAREHVVLVAERFGEVGLISDSQNWVLTALYTEEIITRRIFLGNRRGRSRRIEPSVQHLLSTRPVDNINGQLAGRV